MLNATAIIAVSQSTADDILDIYPFIDSSKIFVIPHGSDHLSSYPILPSSLSPLLHSLTRHPFFLYVGSRSNYKGFYILLRSFKNLCSVYSSLKLVCVGSPLTAEEYKAISDLGISSNVVTYSALNCDYHICTLPPLDLFTLLFARVLVCQYLKHSPLIVLLSARTSPIREIGDLPLYYSPNNGHHLTFYSVVFLNSQTIRQSSSIFRNHNQVNLVGLILRNLLSSFTLMSYLFDNIPFSL